jgi:hypothetical protein
MNLDRHSPLPMTRLERVEMGIKILTCLGGLLAGIAALIAALH